MRAQVRRKHSCYECSSSDLFSDFQLISALEDEQFHVGFVEQYDACGLGLLQRIEVRSMVWLSATAFYRLQTEQIGIDFPLSYVPGQPSTHISSIVACDCRVVFRLLPSDVLFSTGRERPHRSGKQRDGEKERNVV